MDAKNCVGNVENQNSKGELKMQEHEIRDKLKKYNCQRHTFIAEYGGTFLTSARRKIFKNVIFKNVRLVGGDEILTDHVWITVLPSYNMSEFNKGDECMFSAEVKQYAKRYTNSKRVDQDWTLIDMLNLSVVRRAEMGVSHEVNAWHGMVVSDPN